MESVVVFKKAKYLNANSSYIWNHVQKVIAHGNRLTFDKVMKEIW